MTKGLILEGGAMRGMFTSGVLDVFMENDIVFDGGAGISIVKLFQRTLLIFMSEQPILKTGKLSSTNVLTAATRIFSGYRLHHRCPPFQDR